MAILFHALRQYIGNRWQAAPVVVMEQSAHDLFRGQSILRYVCMAFGWYHEFQSEVRVDNLRAAESKLIDLLDHGAMIVHVYRETNTVDPEMVGRHARLNSFFANEFETAQKFDASRHQIERFDLDMRPVASSANQAFLT